jgi:DNA-binding transcriptional LysR family regulator
VRCILTRVNLSSLDLNLLLVLNAVLQHGSVAAAAGALHLTPSAISNALARLRAALDDPLFVRRGRGLIPTPRALRLRPQLEAALATLQQALGEERFEPRTTTREFGLAMADGDQLALLPTIGQAFMRALPKARLNAISIDALLASGGLAGPMAELAIAPKLPDPELHWLPLYETDAVVVARRDHPGLPARKEITPELFTKLRHVDTLLALGKPGVGHKGAEDAFAQAGLARDVAIAVPTFSAAGLIASRTDLLAALPRRVAETLCSLLPLRLLELRGAPRMPLGMVWHARVHDDPATRFLRELIAKAVKRK